MTFSNHILDPSAYAKAAVLAREVGEEMLAQLDWMTLKPMLIVDAGCGIGEMSQRLQQRYPEARVLAVDVAESMLNEAKAFTSTVCCAEASRLPLRAHTVDLLYANLLLPWHGNLSALAAEWRRILRPDGLLMLTALGPDTLQEWRGIFAADDTPHCMDMHDLGDSLLQAGLADPVLAANHYTVTYRQPEKLITELCASGMWPPLDAAKRTAILASPPAADGLWYVTYEVIYAHAFAPIGAREDAEGTVKIPVAHLRQQLRNQS